MEVFGARKSVSQVVFTLYNLDNLDEVLNTKVVEGYAEKYVKDYQANWLTDRIKSEEQDEMGIVSIDTQQIKSDFKLTFVTFRHD